MIVSPRQSKRSIKNGRRSCEFSNIATTCIKKAEINLKYFQSQLDNWKEDLLQYQSILKGKNAKVNERKVFLPEQKLEAIENGSMLEIIGEGFSDDGSLGLLTPSPNIFVQVPEPKQPISTIENINNLLKRLEEDHENTACLLKKEKRLSASLKDSVDRLAYERLQRLPRAVQEEHERCAYDVQELKWHCEFQERVELRLKEQVRLEVNVHTKLQEETDFLAKNSPLVEEKLEVEKCSMELIEQQQNETNVELDAAIKALTDEEKRFKALLLKSNNEQQKISDKLLNLRNKVSSNKKTLISLQKDQSNMIDLLENVQGKIEKLQSCSEGLDDQLAGVKSKEIAMKSELAELENRIHELITEQNRLVKSNETSHDNMLREESVFKNKLAKMACDVHELSDTLRSIVFANRESDREIVDLNEKLAECEKQKISDAKAVVRANSERERVMGDLKIITEEREKVNAIYKKYLSTLKRERMKADEVESDLILNRDTLNKNNKNEKRQRTILQARIDAERDELRRQKKIFEAKRNKMLKAETDVKELVEIIDEQVRKLSEKVDDQRKAIRGLDKLSQTLQLKHEEIQKNVTEELAELKPKESLLKERIACVDATQKKQDETRDELNKKRNAMASSSVAMNRILSANESMIATANAQIEEVEMQLEELSGRNKSLNDALRKMTDRINLHNDSHTQEMMSRGATLEQTLNTFNRLLQENKLLASKYGHLQNKQLCAKNQFYKAFERLGLAKDALNDKKDLCDFHERLHEAMKSYYQLRNMQTKAGLSRFAAMTRRSDEKLLKIQSGLESSLEGITKFLTERYESIS